MNGLRWLVRSLMLLLLAGVLLACSDLENGSGSGLALNAQATGIKSITFQWRAVSGASHYKLFVNPDGVSGYSQLGSDLTTTSSVVAIPVHLTDWLNARYLVEAHNASGVIASSVPLGITSLLLETIGYAKASNTGFGDAFGYRVALSGDGTTLAVSAASDGSALLIQEGEDSNATGIDGSQTADLASNSGAVYLFVRSGESWVQQAYIKASNTGTADAFGSSLALSGDGNTLAVGANGEDSSARGIGGDQFADTAANAGAVYLFTRAGTIWSQQAYIKASNAESGDAFGSSLALSSDGNTLAVGASGEDSAASGIDGDQFADTMSNAGAVYLFTRSATLWSQQAYIKASNADSGDTFGASLALSSDGNTLAVGALGEDSIAVGINGDEQSNIASSAGAAYLFVRSAGIWSQQAYVKASNTQAFDRFGGSVALSGDGNTLAIGAVDEDSASTGINNSEVDDTTASAGAVYLYTRSGDVWSQQAYVKASNTNASDNFGVSVALTGDGNTLVVGAHQEDGSSIGLAGDPNINLASDAGAVYLYIRRAGVWTLRNYIKAPNTDPFDNFGVSLALSGDGTTLAIGATGEASMATGINGDMANNLWGRAGAVYLY